MAIGKKRRKPAATGRARPAATSRSVVRRRALTGKATPTGAKRKAAATRKSVPRKCSNCRQPGHTKPKCPHPPKAAPPNAVRRKAGGTSSSGPHCVRSATTSVRKCGNCRQPGHTKPKCPYPPLPKEEPKRKKKRRYHFESVAVEHLEKEFGPCDKRKQTISLADIDYQTVTLRGDGKARKNLKTRTIEWDYVCHKLRLVFEVDGMAHYRPVEAHGGRKGHMAQRENDFIKQRWCRRNGYILRRVSNINYDDPTRWTCGHSEFMERLRLKIREAKACMWERQRRELASRFKETPSSTKTCP